MTLWQALTYFGDNALLLPLIVWIAVWLLCQAPTRRDGMRWIVLASLCGGLITLSKLLFMACGLGIHSLNFTGFSGHVALSFMVWLSLVSLVWRTGIGRHLSFLAALLLCLGIGLSRLYLKAHSISEVVSGAVLGSLFSLVFVRGPRPRRSSSLTLGGGVLVIGLLCYGQVFPSQHLLNTIALWLNGDDRVFVRATPLG